MPEERGTSGRSDVVGTRRHVPSRWLPSTARSPASRLATAIALWSFAYAGYRAYYAAGGQFGMIGEPLSAAQFRVINAGGAAIVLLAGILPLVAVRVRTWGRALPVLGWVGAVGCCMHALVDGSLRVLSLTGGYPTQLPATFWRSYDRTVADLQDLLLNEPWFLVEGLLWGALGVACLRRSRRPVWFASAAITCAVLVAVGVLSGIGVIGSFTFL